MIANYSKKIIGLQGTVHAKKQEIVPNWLLTASILMALGGIELISPPLVLNKSTKTSKKSAVY